MAWRWRLALLSISCLLAACAPSAPLRYYALTPTAQMPPAAAESGLVVGVSPIALASYLDRSGLVTRTGSNALDVSTLHNWIEPLDTQARRATARNLSILLGTDRVFVLPEQQLMPVDVIVEIAIERFDIELEGEAATAVLEARWTLVSGAERQVLETAPARFVVAVDEAGSHEARAAALSDALGRLARTVATAIAARRSSSS